MKIAKLGTVECGLLLCLQNKQTPDSDKGSAVRGRTSSRSSATIKPNKERPHLSNVLTPSKDLRLPWPSEVLIRMVLGYGSRVVGLMLHLGGHFSCPPWWPSEDTISSFFGGLRLLQMPKNNGLQACSKLGENCKK